MEFKAIYGLLFTHLKCFNIRDIISIYPKQALWHSNKLTLLTLNIRKYVYGHM